MSEQKLFDYFANQHGLVLTESELREITLEVCKDIGIDSLEPAEWVKEMKTTQSALLDKICQLTDQINNQND